MRGFVREAMSLMILVLAVGTDSTGRIKVRSLIDGEVLVGNQWEDV